jgi:hypothetical protein
VFPGDNILVDFKEIGSFLCCFHGKHAIEGNPLEARLKPKCFWRLIMKLRSLFLVVCIIFYGIAAYDIWFSKYYLSDEYKRFEEKHCPLLSWWYLSKANLWIARFIILILFVISVIGLFHLIQKGEF